MKISSTIMPNKSFEILPNGKTCTIIFYDNIKSNSVIDGMTGMSLPSWDYEKYELETNYNSSLLAQIESDYSTWLQKAKQAEKDTEAQKVRDYRDNLLNACDIKHCNPEKWMAMSDSEKLAWATYKQALRDITAQQGFPYSVIWPTIPADTSNSLSDTLNKQQKLQKSVSDLKLVTVYADSSSDIRMTNIETRLTNLEAK